MEFKTSEAERTYAREYRKKYLKTEAGRENKRRETERRRVLARARVRELKAILGCALCPEREPVCLDFHHRVPAEKGAEINNLLRSGASPARIDEEIRKCVCLCANCHRKVHAGMIEL